MSSAPGIAGPHVAVLAVVRDLAVILWVLLGIARNVCNETTMKNRVVLSSIVVVALMLSDPAQASLFKGEALDTLAEVVSWMALIIVPITCIVVFWLVHILPEKIAEQRKHPQAKAIQVLCLLSLFFGGMLWPIAWLWAYSKPVLYKLAYGTDVVEPEHGAPSRTDGQSGDAKAASTTTQGPPGDAKAATTTTEGGGRN